MVNRIVVGARYGTNDWLAQRVTGGLLALYAIGCAIVLYNLRPLAYETWKALFGHGAVRIVTLLAALALAWHAWVGMRDIFMDYVHATALRLALHVAVVVVVAVYAGWVVQILWR